MNIIVHNFCESRLNDNQAPETINSITALYMCYLPCFFGKPKNHLLSNVALLLQINGIASCYYHYKLNWFGKQIDEISMILANFFGLWTLLEFYFIESYVFYNQLNIIYMLLCISINTISSMDSLFPIMFGMYMIYTIYFIIITSYHIKLVNNIILSIIGFISWYVSEQYCNRYTYLGHSIWHLLFPIGFYKILMQYDYYLT